MEAKKKKKIVIIVIAIVLVAIIVATGIVFAVRNSENNSNENEANVGQVSVVTNSYNEAIALGQVSVNYTGNYIYSGIVSIDFVFYDQEKNITYSDEQKQEYIKKLYDKVGVKDKNAFYQYLSKSKSAEFNGDILVFIGGRYTRVVLENDEYVISELGTYAGDDNLTQVTVSDSESVFYVSLAYTTAEYAVTLASNADGNGKTLYVFESVTSETNPSLVLFTITYAYDLTEFDTGAIPDSELNF